MNDRGMAVSMVYPILKTLVRKGCDTEQFGEFASFDMTLLRDPDARIAAKELERLMNAAAAYTDDDYFGLRQGQMTDMSDMGILGYVMMHSETIADALDAYRRFNVILCSGYNLAWEEQGEDAVLRLYTLNPAVRMSRHCMEDMASSVYRLMCRIGNKDIPLRELHFSHDAPEDVAPYLAVFGIEPRFGAAETLFRMDRAVLSCPILYSDARLRSSFEAIAVETMERVTRGNKLADGVFQWLMQRLPTGFPTLRQTALHFGMSARTLQAKLKEENASFNGLCASVRMELAKGYLSSSEHSVSEIAYLLHYSEPSAFQNAFKKWAGVTPVQFRSGARRGKRYEKPPKMEA
ncbi:AraC family transcriptional regulator [Cohnella cellulosilytica]|uniref:AraC family transcriptional regulator n=1 Tax=Cohnella cellulosilytica TaxID=986710 RepID=A0ABW2F883_9BACL